MIPSQAFRTATLPPPLRCTRSARHRPGSLYSFLSTIGAQASEFNSLNRSAIFESALRSVGIPVAFLRAAWFMENAAWDVGAACEGQIKSYLQHRRIEMVSVRDIGRTAADLMREA
jgi:NAD(P)H dehydrogenase (quinone)